jgi:hypothetical protein
MSHLILNYLHVAPDSTLQKIYKEWQETKIISSRVEELG